MYDQIAADAVRQIREERAELDRLRAEVEALRKDAERYRAWRREFVGASIGSISALLAHASTPDDVDAAIDAAKGGSNG